MAHAAYDMIQSPPRRANVGADPRYCGVDALFRIVGKTAGGDRRFQRCETDGGKSGARGRGRTADTAIFSRMLYQLSYPGIIRTNADKAGLLARLAIAVQPA